MLLVVAEEQLGELYEKLSAVVAVVQLLVWVWQLLVHQLLLFPVMARQGQVRCQDCSVSPSYQAVLLCWLPEQPPLAGPFYTQPSETEYG